MLAVARSEGWLGASCWWGRLVVCGAPAMVSGEERDPGSELALCVQLRAGGQCCALKFEPDFACCENVFSKARIQNMFKNLLT